MTMSETIPETENHHIRAVRKQDEWMVWAGEDEAEYFGLYRHQSNGTSQCIADFTDKADAVTAMVAIEESHAESDAIAPGEYLSEWMDLHDMTPAHVATALRTDIEEMVEIIHGITEVDADLALELSRLTGTSAVTWITREMRYREHLTRLDKECRADEESCPYFCEHPLQQGFGRDGS